MPRWVDETANLPAAPGPSPAPSGIVPENPWNGVSTAEVYGNHLASPVHSPGWPSPRGAGGGFMQLPLPGEATYNHDASAPGSAVAMPPTPPEMLSRSGGGGGGGGSQPQARASGEAVGVAWLGVAETTAASTNQLGGAAASAAAGNINSS